ncbi:tocopherol cyclase family protein [Hydrogenoanaerobacterium sp.]|uniref:tocopherol cyclase family protein n=1 Tax=Hydrogenoanaerobacterium sp. TaxID=2953763 RepID=UPI00289E8530|nr:tocopherol cyclase family protein [Hydrogenoanaerobacterium sp.]
MINFHGLCKKSKFFEGWYFKHQIGDETIAFIPSISIDENGHRAAHLQIITNTGSYHIEYCYSQFRVNRNRLEIQIGNNFFSNKGIRLDIRSSKFTCTGTIRYGQFTPILYDIMGVFSVFPFMECNHGIISLYHTLTGEILINNKSTKFTGGVGYIEKDWGSSFPKRYTWVQSNDFSIKRCCIFASVADIPFLGFTFQGCICVVYYKGREYRFATYNGAKVLRCDGKLLVIKQGRYLLTIKTDGKDAHALYAPSQGGMTRTIHENNSCTAHFVLKEGNHIVFDLYSKNTGFEFVGVKT